MSNVKVELNSPGIKEFLCGSEVEALISKHAAGTVAAAGEGYEYRIHRSDQRVIANVYAATKEAAQENLDSNTILKALR